MIKKFKTKVTAYSKEERDMRVNELKKRGFKVIKELEPECRGQTYYKLDNNNYKKKTETSFTGGMKYIVYMER